VILALLCCRFRRLVGSRRSRYGRLRPPPNCVSVWVTDQDTLNVSAHGYECDLSCREHWDDDFTEAPDDRPGRAFAAFDASHNFGAPPNFGVPSLFHVVRAQGELSTEKSRRGGAYAFLFTIQEMPVP
jgi:hypothetical protein